MSAPDIFISYSREDRIAAQHFAESFAEEGFSVWWDAALHSGETFDEVIEAELRAARAVVVLWSPRSVASRWVRAEATLADRRNKLAPVLIEPCDRPIIFELTHTADLSQWDGDRDDPFWRTFVKDLHRLVDKGKARETSAERPGAGVASKAASSVQRFARRKDEVPDGPVNGIAANVMFAPSDPPPAADKANGREAGDSTELHCLEVADGETPMQRYIITPSGLKIGRTAPADVILPDSRVSRAHCIVELTDEQLQVQDLNSTNGTFVDGERIAGATILAVGSVLSVGGVSFTHAVRTRADV